MPWQSSTHRPSRGTRHPQRRLHQCRLHSQCRGTDRGTGRRTPPSLQHRPSEANATEGRRRGHTYTIIAKRDRTNAGYLQPMQATHRMLGETWTVGLTHPPTYTTARTRGRRRRDHRRSARTRRMPALMATHRRCDRRPAERAVTPTDSRSIAPSGVSPAQSDTPRACIRHIRQEDHEPNSGAWRQRT